MIEDFATTKTVPSQTMPFSQLSPSRSAPTDIAARLSIQQTMTYRWSLVEDVQGYRQAGIDAIGIWRTKLADYEDDKTVEVIRDSGLAVSSISWAGGFTGWNHGTFREAVDDARDAIRLAGRLESNCVVLMSGPRAGHTLRHARRLVIQGLKALADDAAENNVLLALQPMSTATGSQWSFLNAIDETLEVLYQCGEPFARLAFDAFHIWRDPNIVERIPEIAPLVATVQLNDSSRDRKSVAERCLPGDGEVPLRDICRTFLEADYSGYFEIGAWSDEIWNSDYSSTLKTCRDRFLVLCQE